MTRVFTENFETGPAGATLTDANTGFSVVSGSPVFDTNAVQGALAAKFGGGETQSLQRNFTATGLRVERRYFYMAANPSANTVIAGARSSGTTRAQVRVLTTGKMQLRNAATAVGLDSTTVLPTGAYLRWEWKLDLAASQQRLRIFHGSNLHGATPNEEMVRTFDTGTFNEMLDGQITAATWVTYEDAFASDDADWIGPLVVGKPLAALGVG